MNDFRVILKKDGDSEWMRFEFPDENGALLKDEARLLACFKLGSIMVCEPRGLFADGRHVGYFRDLVFGTTMWHLYEIRMFADMAPILIFKEKLQMDERDALVVTLVPERIEMVMTKHQQTEIIIKG